ncbi:MAG: cation:proton antiporter [Candidatus Aenigmarchaeota archaeon]|nr:cation:proton antiporter [Candidatus Aenigmarchaeota archaeon]MCK4531842.1 cation:proton antiporter [Candidatus Aenigmarchaeota archaeon]
MIEYVVFLLVVAVFIGFVRLAKGPTIPDRVLVADTINSLVIGIIVLVSLYYANDMLIDIAIVYAMLSFLGTLAVSKYIIGKEMHE